MQISPDGACAAAGAASCARQTLPSSSPPRHQASDATQQQLSYPPRWHSGSYYPSPHCCAAQSSASPHPRLSFPAVPSDHQLLVLLSAEGSDEDLEPAHQPRRPSRAGAAEHHGGRGAVPCALPSVAGADAAPGQQLRRRRAHRRDHRVRPSPSPSPSRGPVQAAHARLPAVAPGPELQHGPRRPGRRGQRPAAAADGRAPGAGDLRRGAGRAPGRAHRAQDAPPHRLCRPQGRDRRGRVPHRRLRRLLRHRRLARHRPQRQGPARGAQEPRRLHRPDRACPRTPTPPLTVDPTPEAPEQSTARRHRATAYNTSLYCTRTE
uniref:Uncharacterized protein n=1 Tax=Zea mays TaxID=4577 RepID=A0A804P884_MAIZE